MAKQNEKKNPLIGQGTYGCIYYPEITCSGVLGESKKLISNENLKDTTSKVLEIMENQNA